MAKHRAHQLVRYGYGEKFGCVGNGSPGARRPPAGGPPAASRAWKGPRAHCQLARFGYGETRAPGAGTAQGPLRELADAAYAIIGLGQRAHPPKSSAVDWRVTSTARREPREARPSTAPLQAPGAAGPLDGEVLTNKSSQGRADAQRLVATRLLDRVHDPLGHFSRLQRIYPRAR